MPRIFPDIGRTCVWLVLTAVLAAVLVADASAQAHAAAVARPSGGTGTAICPVETSSAFAWRRGAGASSPSLAPFAPSAAADIRDVVRFDAVRPAPLDAATTSAPARVYLNDPNDPAVSDIDLENLLGDGTRLEGTYVRVRSDKLDGPGETSPGRDGQADFRFDPIMGTGLECILATDDSASLYCSRFDAVNVYYHIDRVAREYWIDRLGVSIDFQVDATTHEAGDGGFTDSENAILKLGVGNIFMKNSALEDDVIYHEYAHIVTSSLGFEIPVNVGSEMRALNEGYADYFAASYTDDPRIGEWVVTCPPRQHCEGPPNDAEFRRIDLDPDVWNWRMGAPSDTLQYGFCLRYHEGDMKCKASYNNFADLYVWGMIWGGALWDLRERLGADVVDALVLETVRSHRTDVGPPVDMQTAVAQMFEADRALNGGTNERVLEAVFASRGFPIPISESVEDDSLPRRARVDVYPNPASGSATLRLGGRVNDGAVVRLVDTLGRVVREIPVRSGWTGGTDVHLDLATLEQGMYLVEVRMPGRRISKPLAVVR